MEIKSTLTQRINGIVDTTYEDIYSVSELKNKPIQAVHGYCFYNDKIVIVYSEHKGYWSLPGGGVEIGESAEGGLIREIQEETNMRVLSQKIIGYIKIFEPDKPVIQTRYVCTVEPYGDFVSDPDGDITEIKLINPEDIKKYVDWGEIGEHLIVRALEMRKSLL